MTPTNIKKGISITKAKVTEGNIPVIAGGQTPAYYHKEHNRNPPVITISASGAYAGFVNYFEIPIFASDCTTIKLENENVLSTKYIYLFLKSNQKTIYALQNGAGQPHVYAKDLVKLDIPVCPIEIQKQIVSILERAERLKEKRQTANDDTNKIIQSIFYEMFGDPVKNEKGFDVRQLKDICEKITDGTHVTPTYVEKGVPFLRVTDLTNSNDSKKFISEAEHKDLIKRCQPMKSDVLYSKNGTIGVAKMIDWDYEFSIFVSLCLLKPKNGLIRSRYLEAFLNTPFALEQAKLHSKKGTITNLHLIEIKQIRIPLPTLKEQDEFIERLDALNLVKEKQKTSTNHINILFDALTQKVFNGEMVIS